MDSITSEKCFIAGHKGMVGSAILRKLKANRKYEIITSERSALDLVNQEQVSKFFQSNKPSVVILAAAKVGGIRVNRTKQADFLYENLMIQNNVLHSAAKSGVKKILFLGSSCIYPREAPQPILEEYLMHGPLEPTNEGYALAKISGLKLAQFYSHSYGIRCICPMPCNLYGTNDNFDKNNSHVLAALVRRFVDAVEESKDCEMLWGTGEAMREFLHVDDAADAFLLLLEKWDSSQHVNVGSGKDISIKDLAKKVAYLAGYKGGIKWENSPNENGMPRKLLDVTKINKLNFKPKISLDDGIIQMIKIYKKIKNYS